MSESLFRVPVPGTDPEGNRGGPDNCIRCGAPPTHETCEALDNGWEGDRHGQKWVTYKLFRTRYCAAHAPEDAMPLAVEVKDFSFAGPVDFSKPNPFDDPPATPDHLV